MLIAIATFIITIVRGYTSGYSTILLPQLKSPNSTLPISLDEESWIGMLFKKILAIIVVFCVGFEYFSVLKQC